MFTEGHLGHELELSWVVKRRYKDPLSVLFQVVVTFVPDDVTELFKVPSDHVKRALVFALV